MNVTFLIGNGFDIGVGLHTGYKDFYNVYCKEKESDTGIIKHFKADILRDADTWADFESAFGEYAFYLEDEEEYIQLFENFVDAFSEYLKTEEESFDETKKEEILRGMKKALTSYYHIHLADRMPIENLIGQYNTTFNFITFNYTQCLDKCVETVQAASNVKERINGEIGEIVHVHGYTEPDLIMGVNDSSQIENEAFSKDSTILNELVKPRQNQIIRMNYDYNATRVINQSKIICVYGMSIGETDKKWWELIMNWLQGNPDRHLIVLKHEAEKRQVFRWRRFVDRTREYLFMYGGVSSEKRASLESQIHVDVDRDIFSMDLRKQNHAFVCKSLL